MAKKNPFDQIIIDCLRNGDFTPAEQMLGESAKRFFDGVEKKLNEVGDIPTNGQPKSMSSYYGSFTQGSATDKELQRINQEKKKLQEAARKKEKEQREAKRLRDKAQKTGLVLYSPFVSVGETSSAICTVAGGMGLAVSSVSLLRGLWHMMIGTLNFTGLAFGLAACFLFAGILKNGVSQKKLLEKAKRFAYLCGRKQYIDIEELARSVNQTIRKTNSDIKKMLKKGFFPEGHLDAEKTTLMLSDAVYGEYTRTVADRITNKNSAKEIVDTSAKEVSDKPESELEKLISDGNAYITTLHRLNDEIPGEIISTKLDRLETLLREIFICVEKHPEQMDRMHEVMDYYIPTVIKLVEAYREYDSISEAGEEILDAKKQIEKCIDTINDALKKILNNLFRDSVWDVTTDASVLNTMLAQKGLASPFKNEED